MGRSQAQQEHAAEYGSGPEITENERKNRRFSAEISWWIGAKTDGFTALAFTQVERMRPRAHMVPDSNLSY
jgi:hypothetical protein